MNGTGVDEIQAVPRPCITSTPKLRRFLIFRPKKAKYERGFLYTPSQKRRTPLPGGPRARFSGPLFWAYFSNFLPFLPNKPRTHSNLFFIYYILTQQCNSVRYISIILSLYHQSTINLNN